VERILKIRLYLLDFGSCIAFTVLVKNECVIVCEYGGRNGKASRDWKASKPRCFKNLKINNLPMI
jgi:hypothetical protein